MLYPSKTYGDPDFKLGGLAIWALSRQFPDAQDFDDGNWLHIYARADAPGARIEIEGPLLRTDEIGRFLEALGVVNATLKGEAALDCMERALEVAVRCRGPLGDVEMTVDITPDLMTQSHRMVWALDQSYLPGAIDGCKAILAKYPVRGDEGSLKGRGVRAEKFYQRLWRLCSKWMKNARFS